mgnify:CR=1 FL=1
MFDGLCPALLPSGNAEIRLGAGHWVLGRPALSDRQIPLKNSARQCSSYFQIARTKNWVVTALLEIGKVRVAAVLGQFPATRRALRRARPATEGAPARSRLDSEARPRVALVRVATAARAQVRPRRLTGHSTPQTMPTQPLSPLEQQQQARVSTITSPPPDEPPPTAAAA